MSALVPAEDIETIVGQERHKVCHYGRAVTAEQTLYILHSHACKDLGADLRGCEYSIALDRGIDMARWWGFEDEAVALYIDQPGTGNLRPLGKRRAPQRIQRKRTKGWRAPAAAVYVGRGSKWGNPYAVRKFRDGLGDDAYKVYEPEQGRTHTFFDDTYSADGPVARGLAAEKAVELYTTNWIPLADPAALRAALAGRDLMCWCPMDQPCHADVLLRIANQVQP